MSNDAQPTVAAKYGKAAKVVRFLSWALIVGPIAFVLLTLPGSVYLLAFTAPVVGIPIGSGILGLGISKALPRRRRVTAVLIWSFVHLAVFTALALHSQTWDASTPGDEKLFLLLRVVFWFVAAGNLAVLIVLALPSRASAEVPQDVDLYPEVKRSLWPWLAAAALIVAFSALGIAVTATDPPVSDDGALDVPSVFPDDSQMSAECQTEELIAQCGSIDVIAENKFVSQMSVAEKPRPSRVFVLPDGRLRYDARLQVWDEPFGFILRDYAFIFSNWRLVDRSATRLVYRKTLDGIAYEAQIRVREVGRAERSSAYIDASLETRDPVTPG